MLRMLSAGLQPNAAAPVSSFATACAGDVFTPDGPEPYPIPTALDKAAIAEVTLQCSYACSSHVTAEAMYAALYSLVRSLPLPPVNTCCFAHPPLCRSSCFMPDTQCLLSLGDPPPSRSPLPTAHISTPSQRLPACPCDLCAPHPLSIISCPIHTLSTTLTWSWS